jgi:hypothetical protein
VESGTHAKAQECTDAYGVRQLFLKSQSNRRLPKLVYEFSCDDQPRLRLRVKTSYPRDEPPPNMSGLVQIVLGSDRSKGTVQSSESTAGVCLSISSSGAVEFVRAKDIGDFRDSTPKPGVQRSLEWVMYLSCPL